MMRCDIREKPLNINGCISDRDADLVMVEALLYFLSYNIFAFWPLAIMTIHSYSTSLHFNSKRWTSHSQCRPIHASTEKKLSINVHKWSLKWYRPTIYSFKSSWNIDRGCVRYSFPLFVISRHISSSISWIHIQTCQSHHSPSPDEWSTFHDTDAWLLSLIIARYWCLRCHVS